MPTPGIWEIIIVLVVALLIFGPKRLPELGKSLGSGMRSFKDSVTGEDDDKKITSGDTTADTTVRAEKSEPSA